MEFLLQPVRQIAVCFQNENQFEKMPVILFFAGRKKVKK